MSVKVGDVIRNDDIDFHETGGIYWKTGETREVVGFCKDGYPLMKEDTSTEIGWDLDGLDFTIVDARPVPSPISELDAIERDMADLFDRMRAAIERLK